MNSKNISSQSASLLSHLNQRNQVFFTIKDAQSILVNSKKSTIVVLLHSMVLRGLLMRIKDGLYHIIPYERDASSYFPNWHLTAQAMSQPKKYYIGFHSALDLHGLITQPPLVEYTVVEHRVIPKRQTVGEIPFEFITLNQNHFFGYSNQWIDDFNKVSISDLEKTIIDCLYIPNNAGGIAEIIKAIYKCRKEINPDKLFNYLELFNVQAVNKRLGFILQHLDLFGDFRKKLAKTIREGYNALEPTLPKAGRHNSTWKTVDNIDIQIVLQSLKT